MTDDVAVVPRGAEAVDDPGDGLGAAVAAGLALVDGHALVVNADLPCATPASLRLLAAAGLALVEAEDGTTNALSLPDPSVFAPLYGPGSAARFRAHAPFATVAIPELEADVDTGEDLERLRRAARTADARARRRARVIVLLSGGGGGARFARGLAGVLAPGELTVVGNVGDDVEILGLHVSPDLDSLLYALAGLIDDERGWGRAGESWNALASAGEWGGEDWFRLGDLDLGLHLVRTQWLREGVAAVRGHRAAGRAAGACDANPSRRRTTGCARTSRRPRGRSRSRSGSSVEAIATR